ncbi:MAG: HDOD domain-containing protein [Desulfobacteraceae bacterium]|nr:HDOD domain-containing protein [Desulfobacteraceae bacterium]
MSLPERTPSAKLAQIFARINMSELPAMSANVQELISLTGSRRSAAYDLAKVILKDYSLTNKVLQVVNSAFYSLGWPVNSISRAVTILGFDAVRDIATVIAIFEEFIKQGVDKAEISKLLTRSFLSGLQARQLAVRKELKVNPEEAFICTLLHNLGKIIICIYLPDMHREIERQVNAGRSEDDASRRVLEDLTYREVGEEIARFWNLSDNVIIAMEPQPAQPRNRDDAQGYLQNLASFNNQMVDSICRGADIGPLIERYGEMMALGQEEALEMMGQTVEQSEDLSSSLRYGLSKLKIRSNLRLIEQGEAKGPVEKAGEGEKTEELDALPTGGDKSVNDFVRDLTETLMGQFNLNDFYVNLLEGLYRGVGFDRVVFAIVNIQGRSPMLIGRFGLGEVEPDRIAGFRHNLSSQDFAIPKALKSGKDMAIPPNSPNAFPEELAPLVKDRMVYLFPVCLDQKPIGLLYLDRKAGRPKLDENEVKTTRLFRDFAVMALRKISRGH